MNRDKFKEFLILKQEIQDHALTSFGEYCDLKRYIEHKKYCDKITDIDINYITFEGDEYWSYGDHERWTCDMPTDFMFDETKSIIIERIKQEKELIKQKLETEEVERKEFERLREKFEQK